MSKTQKYSVVYKKPNGDIAVTSGTANLKVNTETSVAPIAYPESAVSSDDKTDNKDGE